METRSCVRLSFENCSESVLIEGILRNDGRAWSEFDARFGGLIERAVRRVLSRFTRVRTEDDIREAEARLFLSLLARDKSKLRTFDPERGTKFSTWLSMLANHAAYDYLRSRRREPHFDEFNPEVTGDKAPNAYDICERREQTYRVEQLLAELSEKDRMFVSLYFGEGLEAEEVAREMGISIKTVYSKKHKIRARLEALASKGVIAA